MVHIPVGDASAVRRTTKRLQKRAKRVSRKAAEALSDIADETAAQARGAARATLRSMRKRPIAWTSAALGAAAVAGWLLVRRGA